MTRPKADGMWVMVTMADGRQAEAIMDRDLLLSCTGEEFRMKIRGSRSEHGTGGRGGLVTVHAPRAAIRSIEVLGVICAEGLCRKR